MFHSFLSKTAFELSKEYFRLSFGVKEPDGTDRAAVYIKDESPVIYFAVVYDFEHTTPKKIQETLKNPEALLENPMFSSIICVNILYSADLDAVSAFADSMEEPRDMAVHNIWWYTDGKELYAAKGQPDKVYGIESCIRRALSNNADGGDVAEISRDTFEAFRPKPVCAFPAFTAAVITANIIIFILGDASRQYALNGWLIFHESQYFRLFTYMFIHADLEHIFLNMIALVIYGTRFEKYFGSLKTAVVYFLSGLAGGVLSAIFNTGFAVGASAAIFGLMGALLAITKKTGQRLDGLGYMTMLAFAAINIGLGFTDASVDNFGHIGGLLAGLAAGILIGRTKKE